MSENQLPWWNVRRPVGFRFSAMDAIVIAVAMPATWGLWIAVGQAGLLLPVVLGHFFLFCNVFRIPRLSELVWGGLFMVSVCLLYWFDLLTWWRVTLLQTPITVMAILLAILRRDYHGLGWSLKRTHRLQEGGTAQGVSDDRS
jgi:hypothetical protein